MDADCLIKLTKGQAKELACRAFTVVVPERVRREVVEDGAGHPDAAVVARNIAEGLLTVAPGGSVRQKGEEAALALFGQGGFDGICSDDRRFVARLRMQGIPYLTPAVLILLLVKTGRLSGREGAARLAAIAPFVSSEEYAVARLRLETMPEGTAEP